MGAALDLEQHLRRALHDRVAPAIAFGLSVDDGEALVLRGGRLSHLPDAAALEADTPFDLASLTKPLTTVTWILRLVQSGRLDLDDPIGRHLEVADRGLGLTPLWRLLTHTTGLPAHREYFRGLLPHVRATGDFDGARKTVTRMLLGTPLESAPGERETYSDLGFLILERIAASVDAPLADRWEDLPMHGRGLLHFRPMGAVTSVPNTRCAATEQCALRDRLVQGEVHDENAWVCGGIAGHAGLFGRLADVMAFGRAVVAGWHDESNPLGIGAALWRTATAPRWLHPAGTRVLGWDTPSPGQSTAGRRFGPQTIGHLGFTGTSIWIDLPARVVMVLLTNRVCPSRQNLGIRALRPAIHDAAWDAVHELTRRKAL